MMTRDVQQGGWERKMIEIRDRLSSSSDSEMTLFTSQFWLQNLKATLLALLVLVVYHISKRLRSQRSSAHVRSPTPASPASEWRVPEIVSVADLEFLMKILDGHIDNEEKWENVVNKRNNLLSYNAKCCKPKDGPLKHLSVTTFESCSPEMLRDFYMDNEYRKRWDKTVVEHEQLQVDRTNGIEIGRTVKKFPFLTPREYILAWRLWEGKDKTFYCFIKEFEHPLPLCQKNFVRVKYFRSGWRIKKVPGREACKIKMFHQEDAGLNLEMAKLAFAKGIWGYVCKMNDALHKFSLTSHPQLNPAVSAISLVQKVPDELDRACSPSVPSAPTEDVHKEVPDESGQKIFGRRPSKKAVVNGLLLVGGAVYLSRARTALGAKVALAYILTKLNQRGNSQSTRGGLGHIFCKGKPKPAARVRYVCRLLVLQGKGLFENPTETPQILKSWAI